MKLTFQWTSFGFSALPTECIVGKEALLNEQPLYITTVNNLWYFGVFLLRPINKLLFSLDFNENCITNVRAHYNTRKTTSLMLIVNGTCRLC